MGELAGTLGVGALSGGLQFVAQNEQNKANVGMMNAAENWQEHMSDTAHQREVADLRAAGLNPILSMPGSGATSPMPSFPQMQSPIGAGVSGMADTVGKMVGLHLQEAQAENAHASAKLAEANANVAAKNADTKSPWADVSKDADTVYKMLHDRVADFLQRRGITTTNAKDANFFFGDPNPSNSGMVAPAAAPR